MPLPDKALQFVGLCMRAGKLQTGADSVEKAVRSGKACLVLVCAGAGPNTADRFTRACAAHNTPMRMIAPDGSLGQAVGKPAVRVAAVLDSGFAARITALFTQ